MVPYSGVDKVFHHRAGSVEFIAELARELVSGGLHPEMNVSGVPCLVTGGEYVLALIMILGGSRAERYRTLARICWPRCIFSCFVGIWTYIRKVILRMVTSIWVEGVPGTWGCAKV